MAKIKKFVAGTVVIIIALAVLWFAASFYFDGFVVGLRNGRLVIYSQYCFDYCPGYGNSFASWKQYGFRKYYGVDTEEECARIGGTTLWSYGWGKQFIGCTPE